MGEMFSVTLNQAMIFFIFMALGFIFCKTKWVPESLTKICSQLLLYVVLPALNFKTMAQNVTVANLGSNLKFFLYGAAIVAVMFAIMAPLSKLFSKNENTMQIYRYALIVPNTGYFGLPMIIAAFDEQTLAHSMVFTLPLSIYIYTVAQYMLDPQKKMSVKKLLNPIIVATILGIAVGLSGLKVPEVVLQACGSAANCMSPLAMIMTGYVLGRVPLKNLFTNVKPYIVTVLRLVLIPGVICAVLMLVGADRELINIAVVMYAMPVGLNSVIFPEAYGGDSKTGAQVCFISTVLALVSIPLVFWAMQRILM